MHIARDMVVGTDERIDGWVTGQMEGVDGWMDGRMDR